MFSVKNFQILTIQLAGIDKSFPAGTITKTWTAPKKANKTPKIMEKGMKKMIENNLKKKLRTFKKIELVARQMLLKE